LLINPELLTEKALIQLRKDLINGNNVPLKKIYVDNKKDCQRILMKMQQFKSSAFQDIYTDAVIVFRDNIVSGKIRELTSIKNYLVSTCLNMSRQAYAQQNRKKSKVEEVQAILYPEGDKFYINKEENNRMIEVCKTALELLTENCQRILLLYYVHNLSMKEIAEEMKLSSSDVSKTMKSRCYKKWITKTKELL